MERKKWLTTEYPEIIFEDNTVGQLKKEVWDASEAELDAILAEYEIPSPSELGKAGLLLNKNSNSNEFDTIIKKST